MADEMRSEPTPEKRLREKIARSAERHLEAEREQRRSIWFSLGLLGVVGWSIAVPALLGIGLGQWIDSRWPGHVSWTLTLLFIGVAGGCFNVWRWVKQESQGG